MREAAVSGSERVLILTPFGRDAFVAAAVLREAGLEAAICVDLHAVRHECEAGAAVALIVEEVLQEDDYAPLAHWIDAQPPWSDFPIVVLARRGGGLERNPAAERYSRALGNVSYLERPFHPTTLLSMVQTALRGRRRQYEARERLETLRAAIHRQQLDQSHLRLLINELNHRVKNTLATVQSIVTQTLRSGGAPLSTRDTLTARIVALSKAHDVLTNEQWSGANLGEIVAQAVQPFRLGLGEERIVIGGPKVRLEPKTAIAIALALHELATNAVKYGALSTSEGRVDFTWDLSKGRGPRELTATWREVEGPRVSPPGRGGFGTRLIERGLAADLNGEVRIAYPADGVVCTIRARLKQAEDGEATEAPKRSTQRREATYPAAEAAPPA